MFKVAFVTCTGARSFHHCRLDWTFNLAQFESIPGAHKHQGMLREKFAKPSFWGGSHSVSNSLRLVQKCHSRLEPCRVPIILVPKISDLKHNYLSETLRQLSELVRVPSGFAGPQR